MIFHSVLISNGFILLVSVCVCVLTGLQDGKYDQILRWWSSKPQSGIAIALEYVSYCYVLLPCLPCYSSTHLSYHIRSFSHPGVSRLHPSIPNLRSASTQSPGSYCVALSPRRLLLFDSHEISAKVALSCFSAASWFHHAYILRPTPS